MVESWRSKLETRIDIDLYRELDSFQFESTSRMILNYKMQYMIEKSIEKSFEKSMCKDTTETRNMHRRVDDNHFLEMVV